MTAVTICSDFGAQENKVCHCFHCFPINLPWSDAMILIFWMLSFKPTFSLFSFTFIKRLFSSSLLSPIRVMSSAYLRLLIFLLAILIAACAEEETDRTGSILKAGLRLGPDCGLWAMCPVSMETTYQMENQPPLMEEPQGSHLDSPSPKRIP